MTIPAIGQRHNSVIIQTITPTDNDDGSTSNAYATLATVKAAIQSIAGEEYMEAGQQRSGATHKIVFPYSADYSALSPKNHRLLFGTRVFHIVDAQNVDERNEVFEVICKEMK